MKVQLKKNKSISSEQSKVIQDFIKMIQQEAPLNRDVHISFIPERDVNMTTGVRFPKGKIFILSGNRLLIDILRTLAHEWIHEYQMTILNREMGPNIGGQNEDEANAISAQLIKMFEKFYPEKEKFMYE